MILYSRKNGTNKGNKNKIPNEISLLFIKNFITDEKYKDIRKKYYIKDLNKRQTDESMEYIKELLKGYKGLDIVTKQNKDGDITKIIL